jgi:hypothetical protein
MERRTPEELKEHFDQANLAEKSREAGAGLTPEQAAARRALEREFGGAENQTFTPESAKRINERFHVAIYDREGKLREEHQEETNSYNKKAHNTAYKNAKEKLAYTIKRKRWDGHATLTHRYQLEGDPRNTEYPQAFYTGDVPYRTGKFRLRFVGHPQYHGIAREPDLLAVPIPIKHPIEETPPTDAEAAGYSSQTSHVRKQASFARWGRGS